MNGRRYLVGNLILANDEIDRVGWVARQLEEIDLSVEEMDTLQPENYPRNASEFFLSLFEDKGEKDVHTWETCEAQTSSEINKLKSENANLMIEVETLRKERDEAIKRAEELARLVEEQEEDFAHKTRKI